MDISDISGKPQKQKKYASLGISYCVFLRRHYPDQVCGSRYFNTASQPNAISSPNIDFFTGIILQHTKPVNIFSTFSCIFTPYMVVLK